MIFKPEHIEMIRNGTKTQTRRYTGLHYKEGRTYAVQPGRGKKAVPDIRIRIVRKREEIPPFNITDDDAIAEGGYTPEEYEALYLSLYPKSALRWVLTFEVVKCEQEKE